VRFTGLWSTVAEPDEVLTATYFPSWDERAGFAVEEVARRHGDFALAGACIGVTLSGGLVRRGSIVFFGMGLTLVRAELAKAPDRSARNDVEVDGLAHLAVADLSPPDDLHASAALRLRIGTAVAARALRRSIQNAVGDE
jgi:aerobic carbon-monoxide dehydrogenase medium subunit